VGKQDFSRLKPELRKAAERNQMVRQCECVWPWRKKEKEEGERRGKRGFRIRRRADINV